MDNVLDNEFNSQDFGVGDEAMNYLGTAAKWAKFLAIVGFVYLGLMLIMVFSIGSVFTNNPAMDELGLAGAGGLFTVFFIIFMVMGFFPTLYLYRFASNTQDAVRAYNSGSMTEGLKNLKSMFQLIGIYVAIILGIYALAFLFGILGAIGG